ncbi:MAG: D-alanyl-D-alanine carboxypeptidase family protein [Dongiaceae bacterium]
MMWRLVLLAVLIGFIAPAHALETQAKQAMMIDAGTGAILFEKNADEPMHPSSMSKLMTAYAIFQRLEDGRMKMDDTLPVSEKAWRMQGSKMFVPYGERVRIEDLLRGVIVQSGNDACIVLAEGAAGSEEAFAQELEKTAKEIGLTSSTFRNSTGWPDPDHKMTARDLSVLAKHIINDFPQYLPLYSEKEFTYHKIKQGNRNPLLYGFPGGDGLKTGHTEEAGYGLTGTAKRGDRRLIMVLNGLPSMKARAEESVRVLEWGFREFDNYRFFASQDTLVKIPVWQGTREIVEAVSGQDIVLTLPRNKVDEVKVKVAYAKPAPAPLQEGQEIGQISIEAPGQPVITLPLKAKQAVERQNIFARFFHNVSYLLAGSKT